MIDLTPIYNAIIALAAACVSAFVIPWLKRKTDEQEREELLRWVEIAVAAAQQLYHQAEGSKRLAYALEFLEEKGFTIDDTVVDTVEAAVLKLHEEMKHGN